VENLFNQIKSGELRIQVKPDGRRLVIDTETSGLNNATKPIHQADPAVSVVTESSWSQGNVTVVSSTTRKRKLDLKDENPAPNEKENKKK
jgi:hypothetical protein